MFLKQLYQAMLTLWNSCHANALAAKINTLK